MLRPLTARPVFEELEQRLLYSADFAPAALAGIGIADPTEQRLLVWQDSPVAAHAMTEIAFVDMSLPDAESLVADLQAQRQAGRPIEIVRIDSDVDGIARISATLAGRSDLTAVHVLSHGSDGVVKLGNVRLDAATVLTRAGELAGWSAALSNDADLLLYGCDVAASSPGQQMVASLAALTGADVAASNDLTGAVSRGGDWTLEVQTGAIEAQGPFSAQAQAQWQGILGTTYYLQGDLSPPFSGLSTTPPTVPLLLNFDPLRDAFPGLLIDKDNASPDQSDPTDHHTWVAPVGALSISNESVTLTFWTDTRDGMNALQTADVARDKEGQVTAYLMDLASPTATSGTVIATGSVTDDTWGDGFAWEEKTISFGNITYSITAGRHLAVKIVVDNDSAEDDLWFAYDTPAFQSRLQIGSGNTAPSLGLPGGAMNYTENAAATVLDGAATVTDPDSPNFDSGALTVDFTANGSASDRLAIRNQGTGAGQIGVSGGNVSYGGTTIGTWSGGTAGATPLVVSFNSSATPAAVQALARNITYENLSDAPSTAARTVRFVVTDGDGGTSGAASKTVNVSAINDSPVITSDGGGASASVSAAENSIAVTTVTATDADAGATLTYSISGGADAAAFTINASTGVLNFIAAPAYGAPTDTGGDNVYDVAVQVSDGALTDTQAMAVTVTDANDNAPGITANSLAITEGGTAAPVINAIDPDSSPAQLSYTVSGLSGGRFELNASPGVAITTFTQSDINAGSVRFVSDGGEASPAYQLTLSDGALSTTAQAASVSYTNVNDAPIVTSNGGGPIASLAISENTTLATTTTATDPDAAVVLGFAITGGTDAALFTIDSISGALSFIASPDYELPADANADNRYEVIVAASDGSLTAQQALFVDVGNQNETPTITTNSLLLSGGGATLVLLGTDPDTATGGLSFRVTGAAGGQFEFSATPGQTITNFSQAQIDAGEVRFVQDGSGAAPTYALELTDGVSTVASAAPLVVSAPAPAPAPTPAAAPTPTPAPAAGSTPASAAADPTTSPAPTMGTGPIPAPAAAPAAAYPSGAVDATPGTEATPSVGRLPAPQPESATTTFELASTGRSSLALVEVLAQRSQSVNATEHPLAFTLPSEGTGIDITGVPSIDIGSALRERTLADELDRIRDEVVITQRAEKELVGSGVMLSTGLSVGYVLWLARGGVLVASLLSSLPAWAMMDPLPVLAQMKRRDGKKDGDLADDNSDNYDPIEKLFSKARQMIGRGAGSQGVRALPDARLATREASPEQPA